MCCGGGGGTMGQGFVCTKSSLVLYVGFILWQHNLSTRFHLTLNAIHNLYWYWVTSTCRAFNLQVSTGKLNV